MISKLLVGLLAFVSHVNAAFPNHCHISQPSPISISFVDDVCIAITNTNPCNEYDRCCSSFRELAMVNRVELLIKPECITSVYVVSQGEYLIPFRYSPFEQANGERVMQISGVTMDEPLCFEIVGPCGEKLVDLCENDECTYAVFDDFCECCPIGIVTIHLGNSSFPNYPRDINFPSSSPPPTANYPRDINFPSSSPPPPSVNPPTTNYPRDINFPSSSPPPPSVNPPTTNYPRDINFPSSSPPPPTVNPPTTNYPRDINFPSSSPPPTVNPTMPPDSIKPKPTLLSPPTPRNPISPDYPYLPNPNFPYDPSTPEYITSPSSPSGLQSPQSPDSPNKPPSKPPGFPYCKCNRVNKMQTQLTLAYEGTKASNVFCFNILKTKTCPTVSSKCCDFPIAKIEWAVDPVCYGSVARITVNDTVHSPTFELRPGPIVKVSNIRVDDVHGLEVCLELRKPCLTLEALCGGPKCFYAMMERVVNGRAFGDCCVVG